MTIPIIDLGWENAEGETERIIHQAHQKCIDEKHNFHTTNEGVYGTMHSVICECGIVYHYDSGD